MMALTLAVVLSSAIALQGPTDNPLAKTTSGVVEGRWMTNRSIAAFKGIPYAAPPIGPLRWAAPVPPSAWEGVRDAGAFGPACPQAPGMRQFGRQMLRRLGAGHTELGPIPSQSEDCLSLNVWTPNLGGDRLVPVLVWIHGGGYRMGGSAFDQSPICAEGVVAVSFNMRLGVLGFFSHPSLSAESQTGSSGNQGLQDSVAVLKWVRDNIKAFGGDPSRVTVGGLSAGGSAAAILLSIPEAMGLFHGVISISPAPIGIRSGLEPGVQGQYDAHTYGEMLSTGLGLGPDATTEDMRAVSVEALIGAQMGMEAMLMHVDLPFTPRVDGSVLPEPVFDRFGSGNAPNVPLLIGIAADESGLVGEAILDRMNRGDFSAHLKRLIGEGANEVIARYPHDGQTILKSPMAQFTTDWLFTANARGTADHWARAGHPAFLYFNAAAFPPDHPGAAMGSFHGYAFNNGAMNAIDWDPKGVFDPLSARMMRRLGSFIRTGDPNVGGLPVWEPYDRASDPYLHLDHDADTPSRGLRPGDLDPLQQAIETRGQ